MTDPLRTPHGHYLRSASSGAGAELVARWNDQCRRTEAGETACDAAQPCRSRGGDGPCPCEPTEGRVLPKVVQRGRQWVTVNGGDCTVVVAGGQAT